MATTNGSLRILVADDNKMIRGGMCSLLQSHQGWTVCGEAADGTDAVEKAIALNPDVILLDISMPHLNGLEAAKYIHKRMPACKILVVTEHDAKTLENMPPQLGVCGYIMKSRLDSDLISAIEAAGFGVR
jgi:DNA-binding NarL/FixJ family response regulator